MSLRKRFATQKYLLPFAVFLLHVESSKRYYTLTNGEIEVLLIIVSTVVAAVDKHINFATF